jgi:hypothetical protein
LGISGAPARARPIDRENILQKTPDLYRTDRGIGCMGGLGGNERHELQRKLVAR